MRRYALALFLVCIGAAYAALQLRPDPAVELEATLLRMESADALERLDAGAARTTPTKNIRLLHARLAATAGAFATAQEAYANVIELGGASAALLDELAMVAALSGDLELAAKHKADAQALSPDAERRETLGFWYRLLGEVDRERALLSSVPAADLSIFERTRLCDLYLAAGDIPAYRAMLTEIADLRDDAGLSARRDLLVLHLDTGEPDAALDLARAWQTAQPDNTEQLEMVLTMLIGHGAMGQAAALAHEALAANPEIGAVPTLAFITSGHGGLGREMQSRWLAEDRALDEDDWLALVRVAERSGDMRALQTAIARHRPDDLAPPSESFVQFLRYQGPGALLPYRAYMTPETFEEVPLVGAAWHGWHYQPEVSFHYLAAASQTSLSDWDRSIWLSVAADLRGTPFYRRLLVGGVGDTRLREMMLDALRPPVVTSEDQPDIIPADRAE